MEAILVKLSENSFLYLYSSFIQANAAILAIVGFYVIFRIQSLQSTVDVIKSDLMRDHGQFSHPTTVLKFDRSSLDEKEVKLKTMKESDYYYLHYVSWLENVKIILRLKNYIQYPTLFLTLTMILDAICLLFATNLYQYHFIFSCMLAYIVVLIHIVMWLYVSTSIIAVINKD